MSPDALNPASPSRDINAIVEDAAKRFDDMDNDLKSLMQDMKSYQTCMAQLNENRLKVRGLVLVVCSPLSENGETNL